MPEGIIFCNLHQVDLDYMMRHLIKCLSNTWWIKMKEDINNEDKEKARKWAELLAKIQGEQSED